MKKLLALILLGLLAATVARADTPLTIGDFGTIPCCGGPCWDDELPGSLINTNGTFTLPGVSGTGKVLSSSIQVADNVHGQSHILYNYVVDMSGMSGAQNHCVKLLVHFGTPHSCSFDMLVFTNAGGIPATSAVKAPLGDVTVTYGTGCLIPSMVSDPAEMLSDSNPKTGSVTIIDDYVNPASGMTNEARVSVTAIVPDIPPNWAYAPAPFPYLSLQGLLNIVGTNQTQTNFPPTPATNGSYDFTFQLVDALSNGLPVGPITTQQVQVVNGLFNTPLPFDPSAFTGGVRSLLIGLKPSNLPAVQFQPLTPALPITPAPEALYAYSAGVVADITPDQAVLTLNGITGNTVLVGGQGIQVTLNGDGKTITISGNIPSDRNIKTDFAAIRPDEILAKLTALPVSTWRYTNEPLDIRHVGPTAQDFKSAFGLGTDDKSIAIVDEGGVALTAIQALDQRLHQKDAQIKSLEQRLEKLEQAMKKKNSQPQERP